MKKLEEYDTPISNEASFARWTNHAGIKCKTETDSVPILVSRDLERKLAMCRDALQDFVNKVESGRARSVDSYNKFKQALKATSPTTNS